MPDRPLLYLIDASQLVYRGNHLAQQYPHISAMLGFIEFVKKIRQRSRACPLVFAFDETRTQCVRRKIDPDYKAHRRALEPQRMHQFPWVRRWVAAQGLAQCSSPAYEADDLIASLANHYRHKGYALRIVSSDKDLMQLIEEPDQWWDLSRDVRLDYRAVCRRVRLRPYQIPDLLALTGDRADNIPGIRGIGPGIGARLLHKFENIEKLLDKLDQVSQMQFRGAALVADSLQQQQDRLRLNIRLTRLHNDLEFVQQLNIERQPVDPTEFHSLHQELGFEFSEL